MLGEIVWIVLCSGAVAVGLLMFMLSLINSCNASAHDGHFVTTRSQQKRLDYWITVRVSNDDDPDFHAAMEELNRLGYCEDMKEDGVYILLRFIANYNDDWGLDFDNHFESWDYCTHYETNPYNDAAFENH